MKKTLLAGAALSLMTSTAFAGNDYPVELTKDGVLYNCEATTFTHNGKKARRCIPAGGTGEGGAGPTAPVIEPAPAATFGGGGLGTAGAIGLGLLAAVAIAAAADSGGDDDDSTNGTGDEEED